MKAKSVLLTVPLAMSALTFLTLPANAVCWSWKPCADLQGYGYGGTTESQAVLPPLPADGSVPPGSAAAPGASARRHGGARSSRVAGTAETCQEAGRDGDRGTTTCTGGEAETKACSSAVASSSATTGAAPCSGKSGTASGAMPVTCPDKSSTSAGACAHASPGEGSAASAASTSPGSGPGSPATATGSCPQTRHPLRRQRRGRRRS